MRFRLVGWRCPIRGNNWKWLGAFVHACVVNVRVMRSCNAARWEAARRDILCEITEERNAGFRNNVVII